MDFLDKSKISYCDKCNLGDKCDFCRGHKYYILIGGKSIYSKYDFDNFSIKLEQISRICRSIFDIFLFIFFVLGISSFVINVYRLNASNLELLVAENWLGLYPFMFFIGLFFGMLLFYRMQRSEYKVKKIVKYSQKVITKEKYEFINIYDSLNLELRNCIIEAYKIARQNNCTSILPIHLFSALLKGDSMFLVLARLGINKTSFEEKVLRCIKNTKQENNNTLSDHDLVMFNAYYLASKSNSYYINLNHVLMSLVLSNENVLEIFLDSGVDINQISNVLEWIRLGDVLRESYGRSRSMAIFKPSGDMNRAMTAVATPYLDSFSEDLTLLSRNGYLASSVVRMEKIEELYRVIEANNKSVVLVGLPGVGKDNIINSLANLMVTEDVPEILQDKRLVSLSLSRFVSVSASEGRVQDNFLRLMNEVLIAGNIVLVINDIHNMVGVSSQGIENIDLSEVLMDLISKYNLMIIATSNPKDYSKYLENNSISTVLSKIEINEPEFNETVQILESKSFSIEYKYKVFFLYQALERIVKLTNNYIHDQFQPLKAVKIMEEIAVMVKKQKGQNSIVTHEDVSRLISEKVHIPLSQVSVSESEKLLHLEEFLHKRIVGQNEAVKMVSSALRRSRAEIRDEKKPISNLLFLGPTGVGKTELAKTVAEVFFGKEEDMIRLDMSEYQDQNSISRLIGGEGETEGGILTKAIKKNPFSLILLDEIEKAHKDILNLFLQVMDDGRLSDSSGYKIDFSNCIIIATSNAAALYLQDELRKGIDLDMIKNALMEKELRPYFSPEFLNRFNGIVLFKPLSQIEIEQITKLLLNKISVRLKEKNIDFTVTDGAIKELAKIGFSSEFGARPLKRTIESKVDDVLANYLLSGSVSRRDRIVLEGDLSIKIEKARSL